jgi:hypothetical protein
VRRDEEPEGQEDRQRFSGIVARGRQHFPGLVRQEGPVVWCELVDDGLGPVVLGPVFARSEQEQVAQEIDLEEKLGLRAV